MTKTKDLDEFDPQPSFHVFGWITNDIKNYKDLQPIKWLTGEKYMFELDSDFNEHAQIKRWCEQNSKDTVAYDMTRPGYNGKDKIYFFLETDAMAFKLKWL